MSDPHDKESFLTVIPQSSRRDIQPCIVSSVDYSVIVVFVDWQKSRLSLNISTDLSHYLCLSLSLSCASLKCCHPVCIWGCDTQILSTTSTVGGYAFHFPSISCADGIREFLFV